ncbi:tellurite resistance TerB family protein [Rhabdochromatium marinum]|uniref:tellurite resistance TerB family protein n=1 Tax=Rhabdochromatium marinum TaxID=48729 RepID=UPI0019079838|nr:tellurite resistance TerB family protein [Rhabdochromatium marinum]MBK1649277.1 protein YebE [Rhabdochromatium marinum]
MAGFGDLLGSMLQNNIPQSGQARLGNALQDLQAHFGAQGGGSGSLGGILGNLLEGANTALNQASHNPLQTGGLGAMLGSVFGGGGDSIKGALGGGALAMLAGVAFKALTNSAASSQGAALAAAPAEAAALPLGLREPSSETEQQALNDTTRLVIKGMISIAKADGEVSPDEIQQILGRLQSTNMDNQTQAWLMSELAQPLDLEAFVAEIPNQEVAAQVYAASLLAVEIDTDEERNYLRQFAAQSGLNPEVVAQIHQSMGIAL